MILKDRPTNSDNMRTPENPSADKKPTLRRKAVSFLKSFMDAVTETQGNSMGTRF